MNKNCLITEYHSLFSNDYKFIFDIENNQLFIDGPAGEKTIKTGTNENYVIKFNKTKISGIDGARGLFYFISRAARDNLFTCYIEKIIDRFYK